MRQDNPSRSQRRMPEDQARPSRYQFSTADLPYRPRQLIRQRVTMPSDPEALASSLGRRLVLLVVIVVVSAAWLHGGAARQALSWVRHAVTEKASKRLALESEK